MDLPPLYATEGPDTAYDSGLDTPGLVLDFEPEGHATVDLSMPVPSPSHGIDRGAVLRTSYQQRFMRSHDERPVTTRTEANPTPGDLTLSSKRGKNSLPENNPEGYRQGFTVQRFLHRRMFAMGPEIRHSDRLLRNVTAAAATQSPAPAKPNRYTSPFSWNRKLVESRLQFPILRRDPASVASTVQADGTSGESPIPGDWVVG
jgi:hypothetical protein